MPYNESRFGITYNQDLKILRRHFKEMTRLIGTPGVKYFEPLPGKTFDGHGELRSFYADPVEIGCLFHEHPDQKTIKKMGWVSELQESSSLIEVPWDTPNIQVGALFEIPAGIDFAEPRLFRVISMKNIMLSPVSITCEIAPELEDIEEQVNITDFTNDSFTLLIDAEGDK